MSLAHLPSTVDLDHRPPLAFYLSVGLVAGAVIALQIGIMRVFSVGSWAHFGSLVVSLAMLGFGLTSAVMCVGKGWFERHWRGVGQRRRCWLFGPLMVVCNLAAQQMPFNAIFLISDPMQKWRLFANFLLYMLPFLAGAFYLGTVFLKAQQDLRPRLLRRPRPALGPVRPRRSWWRCMSSAPDNLIVVPLLLWLAGGVLWFVALARPARHRCAIVGVAVGCRSRRTSSLPPLLDIPKLAVSDYKGVSYARKFPDAERVYERASPFGYLEVYSSSYLHFAPGLSDNAAFNLPKMPANAYLGIYIDGEGPSGIIRDLPADETAYFRFLPMYLPVPDQGGARHLRGPVRRRHLDGGGAAQSSSKSVTVAEGNPAVLTAFRDDKGLRDFTGDVLNNPKVTVIDYDGRLYLAHTKDRYDVIDLSLADSAGLSSPGGFAIVEKFSYTREAMSELHARAEGRRHPLGHPVEQGGAAEVGAQALRHHGGGGARGRRRRHRRPLLRRRRPTSRPPPCSTSAAASRRRRSPSCARTPRRCRSTRSTIRASTTIRARPRASSTATRARSSSQGEGRQRQRPDGAEHGRRRRRAATEAAGGAPTKPASSAVPATTMGQLAWHHLVHGGWDDVADRYVFDTRIADQRPAVLRRLREAGRPAAHHRPARAVPGRVGLPAAVGDAGASPASPRSSLVLLPLIFGWRTIFSRNPGKFRHHRLFRLPGRWATSWSRSA